jgi:hypothetical protein
MDDSAESPDHGHPVVAMEASTGLVLDMRAADLGRPEVPGLWERLHHNCRVGVLVCANCAPTSMRRYLYLQIRNGQRRTCSYGFEAVREALGESDEHQALKDVISDLAAARGLTAEQEVSGARRQRITDVVVAGGNETVGWEIQLSPLDPDRLQRRVRRAVRDGLAPSWLSGAR